MTRKARLMCLFAALAAVASGGAMLVAGSTDDAAAAGDKCCFTNPRYTGVCVVTLSEEETCSGVLSYLNNPNSVGKPYCGGTTIRGGWAQVECKE
jgi:hypothetical protein